MGDIISKDCLRQAFINSKMDFLLCIKSDRVEGLSFIDFMEAIARVALVVYQPRLINRQFDISIARFIFFHFMECSLEHGRKGCLSRVAKKYLKKKDNYE